MEDEALEKPKKPRTPAQLEAWNKAKTAREAKIKERLEEKKVLVATNQLKKLAEKEQRLKEIAKKSDANSEEEESEPEIVVIRKKKKKLVVVEESEDENDEEPIAKPKPKCEAKIPPIIKPAIRFY